MCLEVKYHCICGVVVRTQRIACVASIAHPNEETHQLQLHDMILPRDEWAARKGQCFQQGCPQNDDSTLDAEVVKCPGCSTLITQGQQAAEQAGNAKFLDRTLWDTHNCNVEFCPFNVDSMVQANENLAVMIELMQNGPEEPEWTPQNDEQIISLTRSGADAELIAEIVGRSITDVQDRLEYLTVVEELLF